MADIARQLGVCTSAIAKAIRKKEGEDCKPLKENIKSIYLEHFLTLIGPISKNILILAL